ncbi:hypothetical protein [Xenorhabdus szentirmaii]|uniref:hypothetical protein n=1 Tax=Xenorhabdus szentirmaii TaxID=290112 RepID=UPI001145AE0A|nr:MULTISPECIES: hypothetical protein [Xenorhabdus]MBD2819534.1 hypothetical protein [Xenorhabdus sp. 42]MBD2826248.1 hypothetical protein [Xenorhabdus sp. 5]
MINNDGMKKLLMACAVLILTGCGENYSEYNGIYTCRVGRLMNYIAVDRGSEYSFPLGTVKARVTFNDRVMIIHGMKSGDYVGHEMTLTSLPGKLMFKYDNDELSEGFSPHDGIATITIDNPRNDRIIQQLTNCKKE